MQPLNSHFLSGFWPQLYSSSQEETIFANFQQHYEVFSKDASCTGINTVYCKISKNLSSRLRADLSASLNNASNFYSGLSTLQQTRKERIESIQTAVKYIEEWITQHLLYFAKVLSELSTANRKIRLYCHGLFMGYVQRCGGKMTDILGIEADTMSSTLQFKKDSD